MSKTQRSLILSAAMACLAIPSYGQRSTDLQTIVTAPAAGFQLAAGAAPVHITFDLKNNGPGNLVAGDTLFFSLSLDPAQLVPTVLTQALNSGQSAPLDVGFGMQNPGNLPTDQTIDVCVLVLDPNSMGVTANGLPVHVTYNDPNTSNNQHCVSVTVKKGTTGLDDLQQEASGRLVLYPNPARSACMLYTTMEEAAPVMVSICDITGRAVVRQDYGRMRLGSSNPVKIDTGALPAGQYIVTLHAGNEKITGRLTVRD